jgi:hypothetical protein
MTRERGKSEFVELDTVGYHPSESPMRKPWKPSPPLDFSTGSWVLSSFDLLQGTDITEDADANTIPADLFDELFQTPNKDRTRPQG